jgi:excisionase family DNA binding protein
MPKTMTRSAPSDTRACVAFLSVKEAADMLKISQVSIRRYLGQGKLKRFKVGARTLIRHSDVMGLVREA